MLLLNFLRAIDGLWLPRGNELIIVVTTNYKERVDTALLVPGRMDMHIHMPYCTFSAFKQLASRVLGIGFHKLYKDIEELLGTVEVTLN